MAIRIIGNDGNSNVCFGGIWNHENGQGDGTNWGNPLHGATEFRAVFTLTPTGPPVHQDGTFFNPHGLFHCGVGPGAAGDKSVFEIATYTDGGVAVFRVYGDNGGPELQRYFPPPVVGQTARWGFRWRASDGSIQVWRDGVNVSDIITGTSPAHLNNTGFGAPLELGAFSYVDVFAFPGDYAECALWTTYGTDQDMILYGLNHVSPNGLPTTAGRVDYLDLRHIENSNQVTGVWSTTHYGVATRLYGGSGGGVTQPYQGLHGGYSEVAHPEVFATDPTGVTPKYFVKTGGSDAANGLSDATAWATLAKVNATTLVPGDVVGFRGGDSFSGSLLPSIPGGGNPDNPIIFGAYGTGKATILPAVGGYGFSLANVQGIELSKLIFTAADNLATSTDGQHGIWIHSTTSAAVLRHIHVDRCETYGFPHNGITIESTTPIATGGGMDDVRVTNCIANGNLRTGIWVADLMAQAGRSSSAYVMTNCYIGDCVASGNLGTPNTRPVIPNYHGDGIFVMGWNGGTVERCVTADNGANNTNGANGGPVGILAYFVNGVTIQYNECYNTGLGANVIDGFGIDCDVNAIRCVVQYNYTHGNRGAGLAMFQAFASDVATQSCVFRYNISEDDCVLDAAQGSILVEQGSQGGLFYGNTIFSRQNGRLCVVIRQSSNHIKIYNNLLITSGAGGKFFDVEATSTTGFEARGNDYWQFNDSGIFRASVAGTTYTSLADFRNGTGQEAGTGFNVDPLLVAPGNGGTINNPAGMVAALTEYQLQSGSPIAGQGLDLDLLFPFPLATSPGLVEFYGNTLPLSGPTTLGASLVSGAVVGDTADPTINITSPTSGPTHTVSTTPLTLAGTAADNVGVTQVTWSNDRGGSGTASGTTSWSVSGIVLQSGANVLTVTAHDAAGNTAAGVLTVTLTQAIIPPTPPQNFVSALPATLNTGGMTRFCHVGDNFATALENCVKGDVLVLDDGASFEGPFGFPDRPGAGWITICSASVYNGTALPAGVRVTRADAPQMARLFTNSQGSAVAIGSTSTGYRLIGLEIDSTYQHPSNPTYHIIFLDTVASRISIERCWVHGRLASALGVDASSRHAITAQASDVRIQECRIDALAGYLSDQCQAIFSSEGAGPFLIHNNYLEAPGEDVLFGGEDPTIPNRVPADITITNNTFNWNPDWYDLSTQTGWGDLRHHLELKNARRVLIEGNLFTGCWATQVGFTIRNQSGTAPWCVVEDVMFRNNRLEGYSPPGVAGGSFLVTIGTDNDHPSGNLARVAIINNLMLGCEITFWASQDQRARMPDLWIEHNTILPCRRQADATTLIAPVVPGDPLPGGFLRARFANNVLGMGDYVGIWYSATDTDTFTFQSVIGRNVLVYIPPGLVDGQGLISRSGPPHVVYPQAWVIEPPGREGLDVTTGIIAPGSPMLTFGLDINGAATHVGVDHVALAAALAGGGEPEPPVTTPARTTIKAPVTIRARTTIKAPVTIRPPVP